MKVAFYTLLKQIAYRSKTYIVICKLIDKEKNVIC